MKDRDYSISFVRFLAMGLIVACHVMQGIGNSLAEHLNIGVQIFLVISGWLHFGKIESPIRFLKRRIVRVFVPCLLLLTITIPLYVWCDDAGFTLQDVGSWIFLRREPLGLAHLWFVRDILVLYFMTPYLCQLEQWMSCGDARRFCVLSCSLFAVVIVVGHEYFEVVHPAIVMCYLAGYLMRALKERYKALYGRFERGAIGFFVLALAVRIAVECGAIKSANFYASVFPFLKVAEGFGLFLLLKAIGALCFRRGSGMVILKLSDRYSYEVYLCHHIFLIGALAFPLTGCGIISAIIAAIISAVSLEYVVGALTKKEVR